MNPDENESPISVAPDLTATRMEEGKSNRGPLERFARQLELRRVSRTALSYSLIVWFNVQIGDVVFPMLGLPDWTLRLIVMIGVMGFPLVLFLAWTFQITPHGVKVDVESRNAAEDRREQEVDVKINLVLLLLGLTLAGLLAAEFASAADGDESHVTPLAIGPVQERPSPIAPGSNRSTIDQPNLVIRQLLDRADAAAQPSGEAAAGPRGKGA